MFFLEIVVSFLAVVLPVLIGIAYLTLAERKIMGGIQQRFGPNVVGFFGSVVLIVFVPQPFSAVANNIIANTKANFFEVK